MTVDIQTSKAARDQLYEIIWSNSSFREKSRRALEVGREFLGAQNGHLTRIDRETNHWTALASTDPDDGQFPAGMELDLETTYCRRTIESNSPIALCDAPADGWADDPAFQEHGLHCYHGTSLVVAGEIYGTVCFVSEQPRPDSFSEGETMFAELLTRLLERELEREYTQSELTRQASLVRVLNRVLRHNLRNEMNVIMGHMQAIDVKLDDPHCEIIHRGISDLLALSNKARALESVLGDEHAREETNLIEVTERVCRRIEASSPDAVISIEYTEEITVPILPGFDRALEELLENAVEHTGTQPSVTVKLGYVPNGIEIRVSDNGPGLSETELEVVKSGVETPLVHSQGLGLWIVQWIVANHDGDIDASVDEDGTTVTITIPRAPEAQLRETPIDIEPVGNRYRSIFETIDGALFVVDDDLHVVDANRAAGDLIGRDRHEFLGERFPALITPVSAAQSDWQEHLPEGEYSVRLGPAEGTVTDVTCRSHPEIAPEAHLIVIRD